MKKIIALLFLVFSAMSTDAQNMHLFYNANHNSIPAVSPSVSVHSAMAAHLVTTKDELPEYIIPLKKLARQTEDDDAKLEAIDNLLDVIKLQNTHKFLSSSRYGIRPFSIFDVGMYNIDTINDYLYSQNNVSAFQTAGFQYFGDANSYITTEFLSFLFGPVRMGVAGSFKASGDTAKDNKINTSVQKILSNGGAINLNFSLPLLFCREKNEQVHFGIFGQSNFQLNPSLTEQTNFSDKVLFTNQSGIVFHFDVASNKSKTADQLARISVDMPFYYVWGSDETYSELNFKDFGVAQLRVGLVIKDLFSFSTSGQLFSSSERIQRYPWLFSINLSPSHIIDSAN